MKITRQDLVAPTRQTSPVRTPAVPLHFWPRVIRVTIMLILLIAAFVAGTLAQGNGWTTVGNLRFQIAALWQQSRLPTAYLDVKFRDAQRLKADYESAQVTGVYLASPSDAITATIRLGSDNIPAQVRLPGGIYASGEWAFNITTQDERGLLGWRSVLMYNATIHHALSQWGLSESLQREGVLSAPVHPIALVFNGDALGVYGMWPAPEEMIVQSRAPGGLIYFDPAVYWQDLRRHFRDGQVPISVSLSDCQVVTIASAGQADQAAVSLLRDLQVGHRAVSDVLDMDQMGTLLALTTLWQGTPLDDWTRLAFYRDDSTGRLRPAAMANLISLSNQNELRWPICFDDPALQKAYIQALERISRPEYLNRLRSDLGSAFEQMQLAFASDGRPELTWDDLAARQKRLARWLEPTQAVLASWDLPPAASLEPSSTVSVSLSNLQRVPVEVLGFDVGKSTFLPIDPAWIQGGSDLIVSSSKGSLVLRAAGEDRLRRLHLHVPYTAVFAANRAAPRDELVEIRLVTRLWGLERRQSVLMQRASGE